MRRPDDRRRRMNAWRSAPTRRSAAGQLQEDVRPRLRIYIGAAPGVGKTYTLLEEAHTLRATASTWCRVRSRRTAAATPSSCVAGLEVVPRRKQCIQGRRARGDGPRRHPRAQAADLHRRRARAHERAGQPARETLSGRAVSARARHQRHDRGQHPASRDAERCGRPGHRRTRARDGARYLPRSRRRGDQRRHDGRGAAHAAAARARSTSRKRSSRRWRTSSASAICRRCASWRCARSPTKSARRRRRFASAKGSSPRSFPSG